MSLPARPLRRALIVSTLATASALLVLGPVGTASAASSSAPQSIALPRAAATPEGGVTLQTEEPALTEADRTLVVLVRLAGLWEIPAGEMAMEKGTTPRVRQIGQMIASQHVRLDTKAKEAAAELGIELPNKPTMLQIRWLNEMKAASGPEFDEIYVQRLRAAHGKIFPAIASVRAGTENDVVRKLAQSANNFVLTHMTLLESTNVVAYDELPKAEALPTVASTGATDSGAGVLASPVIWIVLAVALLGGAFVTTRLMKGRDDDDGYSRGSMNTGAIPLQTPAGAAYQRPRAETRA